MRRGWLAFVMAGLTVAVSPIARGAAVTAFYGDDDGFGVGQTVVLTDPNVSHAGPGEAPFTDVRLIGNSSTFDAPAFTPTGSFQAFTAGTILSATLTLRAGAFDSGPNPVDGPNMIFLDGMLVAPAFIDSFSQLDTNLVETRSIVLPPSFFALLADGSVSLNGTRISEDAGSQSFQIDFLRLDIVTAAVPEPATLFLFGIGLAGLGFSRRKRAS